MEKYGIRFSHKRGTVYADNNGFIEMSLGKKTYSSFSEFNVDYPNEVITSKNKKLVEILSSAGFNARISIRQRIPWRLFVETELLDKIDTYVENNYPLNRSDVVNLAIAATLPKIKHGYKSQKGVRKENVCFNVEQEFADKISDMAISDAKNSILLACIYEYFK